jgi:excisionase family DNA binding protein
MSHNSTLSGESVESASATLREEAGSDTSLVQQTHSPQFMSVRQVADYIQINEKKVYALACEGQIPGTKVTGKWLFPKELIDRWLLESSHGGVLADRLILAGSDDPLLNRVVTAFAHETQERALVNYTGTGTTLGIALLAQRRADACMIHWGPADESLNRHPALLRRYPQHRQWLLLRMCYREQGILASRNLDQADLDIHSLLTQPLRWVMRQQGAGSQQFFHEIAARFDIDVDTLNVVDHAFTEREAAATVSMGLADVAPGTRAAANEFHLLFFPVGWEAFDLVVPRNTYFRTLFQQLLDQLRSPKSQLIANQLGGYDFSQFGTLIWAAT